MIETRVRCERNTYSNQQDSDWFDHILTNIEMCLQKTSNVSANVNFIKKTKTKSLHMLPTKPIPTCIWKYENTDILSNSNSFANIRKTFVKKCT